MAPPMKGVLKPVSRTYSICEKSMTKNCGRAYMKNIVMIDRENVKYIGTPLWVPRDAFLDVTIKVSHAMRLFCIDTENATVSFATNGDAKVLTASITIVVDNFWCLNHLLTNLALNSDHLRRKIVDYCFEGLYKCITIWMHQNGTNIGKLDRLRAFYVNKVFKAGNKSWRIWCYNRAMKLQQVDSK